MERLKNNVLLLLTALIWGCAFVAQSVGMDYVGPFTFNAVRCLIGAAVLVPVIFLTAMGETADRIAGLETGADDYLPKPFEPRELVLRIRNILRRAPKVQKAKAEKLNLGLCLYDPATKELLTREGQIIHLTPVEQALLSVLGQKFGQVFSREKLAELLGAGQSPRSIDVQITRLRKKIEKDSKNPRYLQTVRGKGYMLLPE